MIGYVTLGTNDLDRSIAFYDPLFETMGEKQLFRTDRGVLWGKDFTEPSFMITTPFDGQAASAGNGGMVAFQVNSKEKVTEFYNKALSLGATCEGEPGARSPQFFAAYFRDLDGNKLNFFFSDYSS